MFARLATLALVVASPALAPSVLAQSAPPQPAPSAVAPPAAAPTGDYNRPGIVRGLCQKDGCDEFSLVARDKLRETPEGILYRTRVKTFHASQAGRRDQGEENGYVYCSTTRPAIMAEQNGRTTAFYLAPYSTQDSRETVRNQSNFLALYFTLCHGAEAGRNALRDLPGTARGLGYQVPLAQSRFAQLARAEDVLTPGAPPATPAAAASPPAAAPAPAPSEAARRAPPPAAERRPMDRVASPEPARRAEPRRPPAEDQDSVVDLRGLGRQAGEVIEDMGNWAADLGRSMR